MTRPDDAPHVVNKRPRGVPTGPMEYDYDRKTDNLFRRSDFRGTDQFDTRGKVLQINSIGQRSYY